VPPRAFELVVVDVVTHGLTPHSLELPPLGFGNLAQGGQYLGRSLRGELFTDDAFMANHPVRKWLDLS
jgi:hypothetical protein